MTDTIPTRSVDLTTEIAAPADAIWAALTQADLLARWFPPIAEGEGNVITFSYGPDMQWETYLVELEPGKHVGWADSPDGPAVQDWHIETKGGRCVVRFVHSGLKAGAEWDNYYDAVETGWRFFLFNLKHYLTRHAGTPRIMAWTRRPTTIERSVLWDRVTSATDPMMRRAVIAETSPSRGLWATLPELNDALLFVELEGKTLGVYLSTYGVPADKVRELQGWVDDLSLLAT